jgi:cytochrome c oxidase assembly protein subunit 15
MSERVVCRPWLTRFAWLTAGATLGLICIGGLVTSKGAGLAVPDWPNTYGYNLFLFPVSHWVGGILYEHTHRLVAAGVGLLTALLAGWLWARETRGWRRGTGLAAMILAVALLGVRQMPVYVGLAALALPVMGWGLYRHFRDPGTLRWLGVTALAAVILQGVLGGLRVVWLADEIGVLHGVLAQSFLVLVTAIALLSSPRWRQLTASPAPAVVRHVLLIATGLVLVQLVLGATMRHRHAGLAVPDFPLAYGRVWPRLDADAIARYNQQRVEVRAVRPITATDVVLHMTHRVGACAVLAAIALVAARARRLLPAGHPIRRGAAVWLALVLVQFALGVVTVWTNKAADIATAHVAVGSLTLVVGGLLCIVAWRRQPGLVEAGARIARNRAAASPALTAAA